MKSSKPLIDIQHIVSYNLIEILVNIFYLFLLHKKSKSYTANDLDCGIDLGVRTFATVYSRNNVVTIGNKFKKIDSCHKKIDKINSLLDSPENKCKPRLLKKARRKYFRRIKNIITDITINQLII